MSLTRSALISRYYVDEWAVDRIAREAGCHRETVRLRRSQWDMPNRDREWPESEMPFCLDVMARCTNGASLVGDMRTLAFELQRRTSEVTDRMSPHWVSRYAPQVNIVPSGIGSAKIGLMTLKLSKVHPDAIVPCRQSESAAGIDLHSIEDFEIEPGEQHTAHTGIAGAIPHGWVGLVCPRSGLANKDGMTVQNAPGIIDSDYRGEWMVILHNTGSKRKPYKVSKGDRIAQVVIVPCLLADVVEVSSLDETQRGTDGLGSTGK
jgi:dUTP pyrophosphatase